MCKNTFVKSVFHSSSAAESIKMFFQSNLCHEVLSLMTKNERKNIDRNIPEAVFKCSGPLPQHRSSKTNSLLTVIHFLPALERRISLFQGSPAPCCETLQRVRSVDR